MMINLKQVFNKKNFFLFFFFFIISLLVFNQKLVEFYFSHKFSQWVEKDIFIKDFQIDYPNKIKIKNLEIASSEKFNNKNIFEAKIIKVNINLKTLLLDELVLVNNLEIIEPVFYLELFKNEFTNNDDKIFFSNTYKDNLGLAEKINSNTPDKIWPKKKKDRNFLIINSKIFKPKSFLSISPIVDKKEILMSDFEFFNIGNQKDFKHYKDALEMMLFDIFARVKDKEIKSLLKEIYNL